MNDMPGACQSRAVTEPQREKARLKSDKPPQKDLMYQGFRAKRHFERFQNARRISQFKEVSPSCKLFGIMEKKRTGGKKNGTVATG